MHVISRKKLRDFWGQHAMAREPMSAWFAIAKRGTYGSFSDLKRTFASADYVAPYTIFNVGGNNFRLVTVIHYNRKKIFIRHVFTHKEYDKWNKKG